MIPSVDAGVCCFMRAPLSLALFVQFVFVQLLDGVAPDADFIRGSLSHNCCAPPREPRTRETHTTQRAKAEINYIHKQAAS
jgi:hypothetical protein